MYYKYNASMLRIMQYFFRDIFSVHVWHINPTVHLSCFCTFCTFSSLNPNCFPETFCPIVITVHCCTFMFIIISKFFFQFYHSGVYSNYGCSPISLDHGVLVIGYGELKGTPYWLVKNRYISYFQCRLCICYLFTHITYICYYFDWLLSACVCTWED